MMIRKRDPMLGILWIELGKVAGPKIMMKKVCTRREHVTKP